MLWIGYAAYHMGHVRWHSKKPIIKNSLPNVNFVETGKKSPEKIPFIGVQIHVVDKLPVWWFYFGIIPMRFSSSESAWEVNKIDRITTIPVSMLKIEYVLSTNWLMKGIFAPPSERARVYYPILTILFNRFCFWLLFCTIIILYYLKCFFYLFSMCIC